VLREPGELRVYAARWAVSGAFCDECDDRADVQLCSEHARSTASDRARLWLTAERVKPGCDLTPDAIAAIERMADDMEVE
jgi:hypothetical protein